eukprot:878406-Prymnesium_polylepis.1
MNEARFAATSESATSKDDGKAAASSADATCEIGDCAKSAANELRTSTLGVGMNDPPSRMRGAPALRGVTTHGRGRIELTITTIILCADHRPEGWLGV